MKRIAVPALKSFWLLMVFCLSQDWLLSQQQGWIKVGPLKIYYDISGRTSDHQYNNNSHHQQKRSITEGEWYKPAKTLVFIHAGYLDHTMWAKQVAYFSKQYRVVMIDLPGHGRTTGCDSLTPVAAMLKTCLDSLHITKASFIGLSLGGATVNDFAIAYPSMIDKLVLVISGLNGAPAVVTTDSTSNAVFSKWDAAKKSGNKDTLASVVTAMCCEGPFRQPAAPVSSTRAYIHGKVVDNLCLHGNDPWPVFQSHPIAATQLTAIKANTLIIVADKDLPYFAAISRYLHAQIAGSTLIVFHHAAHLLSLEQPNKFNRVVSAFLRRPSR